MIVVKLFFVFLAVAFTTALSHEAAWNNFMAHRPMSFSSEEEMVQRKANFYSAHDVIEEHNSKNGSTYKLDHNRFSLMSEEEQKAYLGARPRPQPNNNLTRSISLDLLRTLPASVDYRTHRCMLPVKNQGACGSCWAFATTALVEFNSCIRKGKSVALSEQQLVDCVTDNYGCGGGWQSVALKYIAAAKGINTAVAYPYTSSSGEAGGSCLYNPAKKGAVVSATKPVTFIKSNDTNTMMSVLAARGLVTIDTAVVKSFMSYKSGVYSEPDCKTNILGYHAMTIVGYGTLNNLPYWIIRNSWGTSWGASGYILFLRGTNLCDVEKYPVGTTITG